MLCWCRTLRGHITEILKRSVTLLFLILISDTCDKPKPVQYTEITNDQLQHHLHIQCSVVQQAPWYQSVRQSKSNDKSWPAVERKTSVKRELCFCTQLGSAGWCPSCIFNQLSVTRCAFTCKFKGSVPFRAKLTRTIKDCNIFHV